MLHLDLRSIPLMDTAFFHDRLVNVAPYFFRATGKQEKLSWIEDRGQADRVTAFARPYALKFNVDL